MTFYTERCENNKGTRFITEIADKDMDLQSNFSWFANFRINMYFNSNKISDNVLGLWILVKTIFKIKKKTNK